MSIVNEGSAAEREKFADMVTGFSTVTRFAAFSEVVFETTCLKISTDSTFDEFSYKSWFPSIICTPF